MSDSDTVIAQMQSAYAAAAAAKDGASFMQLYDSEVRVFDAWECWSYEGATAWEAAVLAWFGSLDDETVQVTFEDTRTVGEQGVLVASSVATYAALSAEGETLRSMRNRMTWAVRLGAEGPRIIHEHTSVPIGFSDMKAILSR